MIAPEEVLFAVVTVLTFTFLSVRVASVALGPAPLPRGVLRFLELAQAPPRVDRPLQSVDLWVGLGLIVLIEVGVISYLGTALASGDAVTVAADGIHWALELTWLGYLTNIYRKRQQT